MIDKIVFPNKTKAITIHWDDLDYFKQFIKLEVNIDVVKAKTLLLNHSVAKIGSYKGVDVYITDHVAKGEYIITGID